MRKPNTCYIDVLYVVNQALHSYILTKWSDYSVELAWKAYTTIPQVDGCITEGFLHFDAGTQCDLIFDWFHQQHSLGLLALTDPAKSGEGMKKYRIPIVYQMSGYVEVTAKDEVSAKAFAISPRCGLPKEGSYVVNSCKIDTEKEISCEDAYPDWIAKRKD